MQNKEAYNRWSASYDAVTNRTRDVEASAFREVLANRRFSNVIELGCGTGKNTEWLAGKAGHVIAVDFSEEMLNAARKKIVRGNVDFAIADITKPWLFADRKVDLITCSLILEHIENIDFIFQQAGQHLKEKGLFYIGELHPFKQYQGSKARFEAAPGELFILECFTHHISEYMEAANNNGFSCLSLKEWFDDDEGDSNSIPRIITFFFQKK
jgi:ubiquinone/menaquinone biosynthesis C-methylase UbiE